MLHIYYNELPSIRYIVEYRKITARNQDNLIAIRNKKRENVRHEHEEIFVK